MANKHPPFSPKTFFSKKNNQIRSSEGNIIDENSGFEIIEAYKNVRTNIMFSLVEAAPKIICITSPTPNEGKTTTCINLAITFAQTGVRVLILDCDLRKPFVHRYMKLHIEPGLTNVLGAFCDLKNAIQKTVYENLDALVCGHVPPNPAELLASGIMANVLEELGKDYDYIFIDTPPINIVTDAAILSKHVAGFVLVIKQAVTTYEEAHTAIDKLKFVGAKISGIILNNVEAGDYYPSGRKYGKSYSRYGNAHADKNLTKAKESPPEDMIMGT